MGICKMHKEIQHMNLENIWKKNNTYEIEFPNVRGVVNYLHNHDYHNSLLLSCPPWPLYLGILILACWKVGLGGGNKASAHRLASSTTYKRSSNVLERLKHMHRWRTAFSLGTLNPEARRLETRWHRKMGKWHEGKHGKTYKANLRIKKTECVLGHFLRRIKNKDRRWSNWAGSTRKLGSRWLEIAHGE